MKTKIKILIFFMTFISTVNAQIVQDTIKNITLPDFIVTAKKDPEYEKKYQRLVYNVKKRNYTQSLPKGFTILKISYPYENGLLKSC
jgi:uncharacterized protein YjdB